ncbi:MAG: (2Fe-2S)-binding protein [Lawsonibacter sp.]
MRIQKHPIIDDFHKGELITFEFDGKPMQGYEGESIAAALRAEGVMVHRHTSKFGLPRGIFCAIGRCTDCVMIVDGKCNIRTCVTPLKAGMKVQTQYALEPKE